MNRGGRGDREGGAAGAATSIYGDSAQAGKNTGGNGERREIKKRCEQRFFDLEAGGFYSL